jgi:hypothetical protein
VAALDSQDVSGTEQVVVDAANPVCSQPNALSWSSLERHSARWRSPPVGLLGHVGLFEAANLVVCQLEMEGDGAEEVAGFGRLDDGRDDDGVAQHSGQRDLGTLSRLHRSCIATGPSGRR